MKDKNDSIGCSVDNCKYHCKEDNYCSKKNIKVDMCDNQPHTSDATCCRSFEEETSF